MLALHGHVIVVLLWDLVRIVIDGRFLQIHVAVLEPEDPDVLYLGIPALVVLLDACMHASPAAYASLDVQTITKKRAVNRGFSPYYEVFSVSLFVICFEPLYRLMELFLGHSLEVVLHEFLP